MNLRVEHIFFEEMKGDRSFQTEEKPFGFLFGERKYARKEVKKTWDRGIKLGIEIGLRKASLEGQKIEMNNNTVNGRHKEFLDKFYALAQEYNCRVQYHHEIGMTIVDIKKP